MKKQYQTKNLLILESELFRTTTTMITLPEATIIVDPNWLPGEINFIKNLLPERQHSLNTPLYLLFTHSDYDHIIGYRAFPGAKVIATQTFQDNPDKGKILQQIRDFDDEYYIKRDYPTMYPEVDVIISNDGQKLNIGDHQLTFLLSPGHNRDGMFTLVEPAGILIAGDYLSNVEFPYIYHSVSDYQSTLDKAEKLIGEGSVRLLISGHGDYTREPKEMQKRLYDARTYIADLILSVRTNTPFDFSKLWKQYDFPKIMTQFHEGNVALAKKQMR